MYYQRPLIFRLVESFFRHWRLFAITATTIIVLLGVYVATRPTTYNTQYTVVMNSSAVTNPLSGTGQGIGWNEVNQTVSHFQTLASTKDFIQSALTAPGVKLNHPIDFDDPEQLVHLQHSLSIFGVGNDAFAVGMSYDNPDDSTTILKALISTFIERNAQEKSSAYTQQVAFIGEQVNKYRDLLVKSEAQLSQFKAESAGHMPQQQDALVQQLSTLTQQVQQYQLALNENQNQEQVIAKELASTPKTIIASQTVGMSPLDLMIQRLQMERDQDITIKGMKPNHPEIVSLNARIQKLLQTRIKSAKSGSLAASGVNSTLTQPNPQYQYLENQLMQTRVAENGLQTQIATTQRLIGQTQAGVAKVPEEERMLANLQRDYASNDENYKLLTHRLDEAQLNEQINLRQQRGSYNVYLTAPPMASTSKSKTIVLFLGGLLLALVVASGLLLLSELLDRSFRDPFDLQRTLGVPVLAMLPESPDLHVADSRNPQLPGGRRGLLGRGKDTPRLTGPKAQPAPAATAAAAATSTEPEKGSADQGGFGGAGFETATGAGGAAAV